MHKDDEELRNNVFEFFDDLALEKQNQKDTVEYFLSIFLIKAHNQSEPINFLERINENDIDTAVFAFRASLLSALDDIEDKVKLMGTFDRVKERFDNVFKEKNSKDDNNYSIVEIFYFLQKCLAIIKEESKNDRI